MVSVPHTRAAFFSVVLELDLCHSKVRAVLPQSPGFVGVLPLPTQSAGSLEGFWAWSGELQGHSLPRRDCQDTEVPHIPPTWHQSWAPPSCGSRKRSLFSPWAPPVSGRFQLTGQTMSGSLCGISVFLCAMPEFPSWGGPLPEACLHAYAATHPSHPRVLGGSWGTPGTRALDPHLWELGVWQHHGRPLCLSWPVFCTPSSVEGHRCPED